MIGDDGQPETEIVEMVIPRFRVTTVFDVSQTCLLYTSSWEDVSGRIHQLLDQGEYAPQSVLDAARSNAVKEHAQEVGIVNRDDEHFEKIIEGHTCSLETYGFSPEADLRAEDAKLEEVKDIWVFPTI